MKRSIQGILASAALLLFCVNGNSCAKNGAPSPEQPSPSPSSASAKGVQSPRVPFGEHWIQDAKIRALMQQMARGNTSWPDDFPEDPEGVSPADPNRSYADAVTLADLLAQAAADIPRAIADKSLPAAKREGFTKEAETLQRHALELKEAARMRKVEQMQRALDQINTTCFACHSQYRDLSGDLNRASLKTPPDPAISVHATSRR